MDLVRCTFNFLVFNKTDNNPPPQKAARGSGSCMSFLERRRPTRAINRPGGLRERRRISCFQIKETSQFSKPLSFYLNQDLKPVVGFRVGM